MAEIKERIVIIEEGKEFEDMDIACCFATFASYFYNG